MIVMAHSHLYSERDTCACTTVKIITFAGHQLLSNILLTVLP